MKSIYKYRISATAIQNIKLPENAKILTIQTQKDDVFLWAEVDTENKIEERTIEIFSTGIDMKDGMGVERVYISTFQIHGGDLVFHAYERII